MSGLGQTRDKSLQHGPKSSILCSGLDHQALTIYQLDHVYEVFRTKMSGLVLQKLYF